MSLQRCTRYSTSTKATSDCGNSRAMTTAVSVPYACRQSGPEAGRKQAFSGSDGGLGRGIRTGFTGVVCVMPFIGFPTGSTLTLWILSEHSKPQPA